MVPTCPPLSPHPADHGFLRVGVAAPSLVVADVAANVPATVAVMADAARQGVRLLVCPELGLTAYTCADLFASAALRQAALEGLAQVAAATADLPLAVVVGLPIAVGGRLYNAAALCSGGQVRGLVPKQYLPNYAEFYEARWFASGQTVPPGTTIALPGQPLPVPLSPHLLFALPGHSGALVGVEICEDLWTVEPPSGALALAGATVLVNPSGSNELLGKADYRRDLVRQQSARCLAAYLYAGAGPGESTTDLVFGGHCLIAENGAILAETPRLQFASTLAVADLDLDRLQLERLKNTSFAAQANRAETAGARCLTITCRLAETSLPQPTDLRRAIAALPFVPRDADRRAAHCEEILALQTAGLAKRLAHTRSKVAVLGLSGGLDSTLALLVCLRAMDLLGRPRRDVLAVTMPGLGTTRRTRQNAERSAALLGATLRTIPIGPAVQQHFADLGHDGVTPDITFENAQARERTQILMDLANLEQGMVVGTGDLSESALGWCTYSGDHISMYHVNIGVPKTLVRHLIEWAADHLFSGEAATVLRDVADTPISPELLPPTGDGEIAQRTEDTVGPYALHDFFLYHTVRAPEAPAKVLFLACHAFAGTYPPATIRRWLEVFYRRFFAAQFKRSCLPDGPKIGSVALSPRGDWRMPSDALPTAWLAQLPTVPDDFRLP